VVLGNKSFEMLQGYIRSKADLLNALDHISAELHKRMNGSFFGERFGQSIDALQQIALQNKGIPGRKNVVWVGHGGPEIYTETLTVTVVDELNSYVHDTTNMLVDADQLVRHLSRAADPRSGNTLTEVEAGADLGDIDSFTGGINFVSFVNETGGNLFYNRNDVEAEIKRVLELGADYYTLTY